MKDFYLSLKDLYDELNIKPNEIYFDKRLEDFYIERDELAVFYRKNKEIKHKR